MRICLLFMAAGLSMGATVAASAATAKCQIAKFSELPVSMIGSQPRTTVNLNGVDLQMVIDSGNIYTAIPQSGECSRAHPIAYGGKSIATYGLSLKLQPKDAMALYGRGIDELRIHKPDVGNADITQATSLSSGVAEEFASHDIRP